jgi:hypothetical protein
MAWVRTTTVGGQQYLQVVYTVESFLKAQQFAASYNQLNEIQRNPPTTNANDLVKAALVIFGAILGAAIIDGLFGQNKKSPKRRTRN